MFRVCYGCHSGRETPGPISNPVAKLTCADGTALGRVWESKTQPDLTYNMVRAPAPVLWCGGSPVYVRARARARE